MLPHIFSTIALFAPKNCTGNSGVVGDGILQTSLVRSLRDETLFPNCRRLLWFGTLRDITPLFPDLMSIIEPVEWDGDERLLNALPAYSELKATSEALVLICTSNHAAREQIRTDLTHLTCREPTTPLDAQSPIHLTEQLHSCLVPLGLKLIPPTPRILIDDTQLQNARRRLTTGNLDDNRDIAAVKGRHDGSVEVDRLFFLHPSLKHQTHDSRTWGIKEWKELARILGEVGNVVVAFRLGDPDERVAAQDIIAGEPTYKTRYALGVTLRQRAECACAATISIARDSGPMHVVAAARSSEGAARVLGLFSVMSPDTWTPRSEAFRSLGQWPLPLELCVTPKEVAVAAANWVRELKRAPMSAALGRGQPADAGA